MKYGVQLLLALAFIAVTPYVSLPNDYYTHGSFPATSSPGSSAAMRAELDAISAGFNKLPSLSGNANKLVVVNPSATGLTVTTSGVTLGGTFNTVGAFDLTFTLSGTTSLVLPVSGTVLTTTGSAAGLTSFPTLNQNTTGSAARLTTPRTINGTAFDGTANITLAATDASTLTGTTIAASVVTSSLTAIGTLTAGAVPASLVTPGTFGAGNYVFPGTLTLSSVTPNRLLYLNGSNQVVTSALSDGQLFIGSTGSAPVAATITAGPGVSVTNGPGTITLSALPSFKIGLFNYDTATPSATQSVGSVGFTPRMVEFTASVPDVTGYLSWGSDDGIAHQAIYSRDGTANFQHAATGSWSIFLQGSADNVTASSTITAFNTDGFVLTWLKQGSPTGIATILYKAWR